MNDRDAPEAEIGKKGLPLSVFLTRMIWLCILPLVVLAGALAADRVLYLQADRDLKASLLAGGFAEAVDQHLRARIHALAMLAESPLADSLERLPELYREALGFRENFGSHVILADSSSKKMLLNTRVPFGSPLPPLPRPEGRAAASTAAETEKPAVGDLFFGPIAKEPLVAVAVPVLREGKVRFLLLTTFEARQFQDVLDQVSLPLEWSLVLRDGTGELIASRLPDGTERVPTSGGGGRWVIPSAVSSWSVVLNVPLGTYHAPLVIAAVVLVLTVAGTTLLGVFGGKLAGRKLAQDVNALTKKEGAGGRSIPAIAEIAFVWRRLNDEARALEELERTRRQNEEELKMSQHLAGLGNWRWDVKNDVHTWSEEIYRIYGRDPALPPAVYPDVRTYFTPQSWERLSAAVKQCLTDGLPYECDAEVLCLTGERRWIIARGESRRDENGIIVELYGTVQDITERWLAARRLQESQAAALEDQRQARLAALNLIEDLMATRAHLEATNAALRETEERFRMAQEGARVGIWDWDVASDRLYWSPECWRLYDLAPGSVKTQDGWRECVFADDLPLIDAQWSQCLAGAETINAEFRVRHRNGETRWLISKGRAQHDADGRVCRLSGINLDITEQKLTELALDEERIRLFTLINTIPDMIWLKDTKGTYLSCNRMFERFFGASESGIIGKTDYDFVDADIADSFIAYDKKAMSDGGSSVNEEWVVFADDGHRSLLETIKTPMLGADGSVVGILGIGRDITRRHEAETALRESEARFRTYIETSPMAIFVANSEGCYVDANRSAIEMLGYDLNGIVGKRILDVCYKEDLDLVRSDLSALVRGERIDRDYRLVASDGRVLWVSLSAVRIAEDRFLAFCQDVSARKAAEAELAEHREHLERLVRVRTAELEDANSKLLDTQYAMDSVGIGIHWIEASTRRFLAVNRFAADFLGYSVEEMSTMRFSDIDRNIPEDAFTVPGNESKNKDRAVFESVQTAKDGREIPVEMILHFLPANGTTPDRFIGFFTDITQRRIAHEARETALREAERLAQVRRDFLANMSHEIRTPLNAVVGLAQIGSREFHGRESHVLFDRILEAGQGLSGLVDDILDFSKIESGKMNVEHIPFFIGEVIDRAVQTVTMKAVAKQQRFLVDEDSGVPISCFGDGDRIQQILVNLLSNAVKFTPPNGRVALTASSVDEHLVFRVADNGIGMSAAVMDRLFQPFEQADSSTTRKYGGTGLGLSITSHLVKMMGGTLSVRSELGEGSVFEVRLPLAVATPAAQRPTVPIVSIGLSEDEEAVMARSLSSHHAIPVFGACPREAALVIVDGHVLEDAAASAWLENAPPQDSRCLALVAPGSARLVVSGNDRIATLERPLRIRHVMAALQQTPETAPAAPKDRLPGVSILAAEDNDVNRLVLVDLLAGEGARIVAVGNGMEAESRLSADGAAAFDLVLTDIQMPEMDGYQLAERIRKLAPGLPVIGLTAHAMSEERSRCLAVGMADCVVKPFDLDVLVSVLRRHLPPGKLKLASGSVEACPTLVPAPHPGGRDSDNAEMLIDWDRIGRRFGHRDVFIAKLAAAARSAHCQTAARLREAAKEGDANAIAALSHALKGTAGNLGIAALRDLADRAEHAAKTKCPELTTLAVQIADLTDRIVVELEYFEATRGGRRS